MSTVNSAEPKCWLHSEVRGAAAKLFCVVVTAVWISGCATLQGLGSRMASQPAVDVNSNVTVVTTGSADAGARIEAASAVAHSDPSVLAADGGSAVDAVAVQTADDENESDEESDDDGDLGEVLPNVGSDGFLRYTSDLTDEDLVVRWRMAPETLGSASFGYVERGRLFNGIQFPPGDNWAVVAPEKAWGTQETIDFIIAAIDKVKEWHPDAAPLRINNVSLREGGHFRPHKSHQNGRDVDLGFYYPGASIVRVTQREKVIDVAKNWALVKALVMYTDVQYILVDKRIQKVLYAHALKHGEDKAWLNSLFNNGWKSIVQHAKHHRDHFHVRFYNGRAQELASRLTPVLAMRPEQNITMHRVRPGDTLGAIARRYGASVETLRKTNGIKGTALKIAQVLKVRVRGPCIRCPTAPRAVIPARRLPPSSEESVGTSFAGAAP
jgi:murein endopeptidase